jgi:hypothetical protein
MVNIMIPDGFVNEKIFGRVDIAVTQRGDMDSVDEGSEWKFKSWLPVTRLTLAVR